MGKNNEKKFPKEVYELLCDPESIKAVATLNEDGSPHLVINNSATSLNGKTIILSEELEKSLSNRNIVRSIWYDNTVALNVTKGKRSYAIKVKPYKCHITGKLFQDVLLKMRADLGPEADFSVLWEFIPEDFTDLSPEHLRREQEKLHPYVDKHLDNTGIRI